MVRSNARAELFRLNLGKSMPTKRKYLGFSVRSPSASERTWFRQNENVTGFASEDRKIVLNPFCRLDSAERNSVCLNEAYRLLMNELNIVPNIRLTAAQKKAFKGTAYENSEAALKQTIVARIASGDPSAGKATAEQKGYVECFRQLANLWVKK